MNKEIEMECKYCHRRWIIELEDNGAIHKANKICSACGKQEIDFPPPEYIL